MESYATPIPQELYQTTGLATFMVGFFLLAYFFIYQQAYKSKDRSLAFEIVLAFLSALSLGVALFLLGLGVGVHM